MSPLYHNVVCPNTGKAIPSSKMPRTNLARAWIFIWNPDQLYIRDRVREYSSIMGVPSQPTKKRPGADTGAAKRIMACATRDRLTPRRARSFVLERAFAPEIAHRFGEWSFRYSEEGRALQAALRRAVSFLQGNRDRFPEGSLPGQSGPLAAIAVRISKLFTTADTQVAYAAMVQRIVAVLREKKGPTRSGSRFNRLTKKRSPAEQGLPYRGAHISERD